jgi:hypothetical protein
VFPDDDMQCAIETCRSSESVLMCIILDYTISAFVAVQYSVNLQNARCNNKDNILCMCTCSGFTVSKICRFVFYSNKLQSV